LVCVALTVFAFIAIGKIEVRGHDEGLVRASLFGVREIPWNDVTEYRYRQVPVNYAAHFGLVGSLLMIFALSSDGRTLDGRTFDWIRARTASTSSPNYDDSRTPRGYDGNPFSKNQPRLSTSPAGDFPNLQVGADGTGSLDTIDSLVTLKEGRRQRPYAAGDRPTAGAAQQ